MQGTWIRIIDDPGGLGKTLRKSWRRSENVSFGITEPGRDQPARNRSLYGKLPSFGSLDGIR